MRFAFATEAIADHGGKWKSADGAKANQSGVRRAREISLRKFKRKAPAALELLLFEEMVPEVGT